jgi:hypothetical protein
MAELRTRWPRAVALAIVALFTCKTSGTTSRPNPAFISATACRPRRRRRSRKTQLADDAQDSFGQHTPQALPLTRRLTILSPA